MASVDSAYKQFRLDVAKAVPGRVLLTKVWGSYSHGCELPESDIDFLAIYQWPLRDALSLHPPAETVDHKGPDYQAHEIGKFCNLLLKGNPATIECLFTDRWCDADPKLAGLLDMRDMFINAQTLEQYLGYGRGQIHRLKAGTRIHSTGGKYNTKWAYHLIRLMFDAQRIAVGDPPIVFKDGDELAYLLKVRSGEFSPAEIEWQFLDLEAQIGKLKPWPIPDVASNERLNDWLYELRMQE